MSDKPAARPIIGFTSVTKNKIVWTTIYYYWNNERPTGRAAGELEFFFLGKWPPVSFSFYLPYSSMRPRGRRALFARPTGRAAGELCFFEERAKSKAQATQHQMTLCILNNLYWNWKRSWNCMNKFQVNFYF